MATKKKGRYFHVYIRDKNYKLVGDFPVQSKSIKTLRKTLIDASKHQKASEIHYDIKSGGKHLGRLSTHRHYGSNNLMATWTGMASDLSFVNQTTGELFSFAL